VPAREIAAKRYAEAVFSLAREKGDLDRWALDLETIAGTFADPQLFALLENSRVPEATKNEMLTRSLGAIAPLALNFAKLLVQKQRAGLAADVADYFRQMVDEDRGIVHAEVTTAIAVSDDEQRLIRQRLSAMTNKDVRVQMRIDPAIIGGVVARIGDRLIDGSTRTRLIALRHRLESAR
jgi:F-type H+-transporting ATPase subunit delta